MAEITWVNHASFVVRQGKTAIISDPWIEGSIFNGGWDLLTPTRWQYEDFRTLTHIWFSHEHPDHFFPPNLKKIPEDARPGIEVLYQKTNDGKVLDFCRKLGFRTRELPPYEWTTLGDSLRVQCGPFAPYDSWLLIDVPEFRILNLNDCQVKSPKVAERLLNRTGPIDVLLSQFSYACWLGNPDDQASRKQAAQRALDQIASQMEVLKPRYFIPSASFVQFSHEENTYLNDSVNTIGSVTKFLQDRFQVDVLPLYPGDNWIVGAPHNGAAAAEKYAVDYEKAGQPRHKSESVDSKELARTSAEHLKKLRSRNNWFFVKLASMPPARLFGPVTVFLTDYGYVVRFDIFNGLTAAPDVKIPDADTAMTSASLAFVLKHDWGFDTLYVNACFHASQQGFRQLERSLSLALLNNTGRRFGPLLLLDPTFCYTALRHFFPKLRLIFRWRL